MLARLHTLELGQKNAELAPPLTLSVKLEVDPHQLALAEAKARSREATEQRNELVQILKRAEPQSALAQAAGKMLGALEASSNQRGAMSELDQAQEVVVQQMMDQQSINMSNLSTNMKKLAQAIEDAVEGKSGVYVLVDTSSSNGKKHS
jgi:hypothetical protein